MRLRGGKKKKKKSYKTPKKNPHKKKPVKLACLKYYSVDPKTNTVTRLRKECPHCGPGTYMANHFGRLHCGRCSYTLIVKTEGKAPAKAQGKAKGKKK